MNLMRIGFRVRNTLSHIPYYCICIAQFVKYTFVNRLTESGLIEDHYQSIVVGDEASIYNNKWGQFKIKKPTRYNDYLQKINSNGWQVQAPIGNYGVLGYPEIAVKKMITEIKQRSPIYEISELMDRVLIHYDVDIRYRLRKKYNLAFDFWLLSSKNWHWKDVKQEIMIWEDRNIALPFGKIVSTFVYENDVYHVYHGYKDRSSENLGVGGWYITSFVKSKPAKNINKTGTIDLRRFIKHLADYDLLCNDTNETYLHNIELGTEVYNTDMNVTVNRFAIDS